LATRIVVGEDISQTWVDSSIEELVGYVCLTTPENRAAVGWAEARWMAEN